MAAAAKMFNVSGRTVASAKVVQDKGVPALNQAVVQGKLSVSAAAKATKLDPATQERVAALAMEGNVKQARKVIADEIAEGEAPRGVEPEAEVVDDGEPIAGTGSISRDSAEMLKKARNEALFGLQMEISERLLQTSGHRSYDDGNIGKMLVFAKIAINSCPDVDWDDWLREGFSKLGCGLSIDDPVSMAERFMDIYRSGKQPARTGEYAALSLSMIVRILAGDFNSAAWSDASLLAAPFASIG
jgi:hypothetical protein